MVGVDAYVLVLGVKGELAHVQRLQLVMRLQVRPTPHSTVDDVWKTLAVGDLRDNRKHGDEKRNMKACSIVYL